MNLKQREALFAQDIMLENAGSYKIKRKPQGQARGQNKAPNKK
jgi:hypothetical protein